MLVLTRQIGQTIVIGGDIQVTVVGVNGNQVRIGIAAPKDVVVLRTELLNREVPQSKKIVET